MWSLLLRDPEKKHRGVTAFIIESDMPGFSVGKKEKKLGDPFLAHDGDFVRELSGSAGKSVR